MRNSSVPFAAPAGGIDTPFSVTAAVESAESSRLPTPRRATQLDIARAAGVHNATVSLALRNSPSISPATRQRIQAIADALGYHPDPALRALASYRRTVSTVRRTETIAYLTAFETRAGWRETRLHEQYAEGARRKALECGYQLEHFWLREPGMTPRRLSNMLFHRGIAGVLLAVGDSEYAEPLDFDWSQLCPVSIGSLPQGPGLYRVASDATGDIRLAVRRAIAAGYRRPGFMLPASWDNSDDQALSMGFITEQSRLPAAQRIPIFFDPFPCFRAHPARGLPENLAHTQDLARWLEEHQPDVIIGSHDHVSRLLSALRVRIPDHVAFVDAFHDTTHGEIAGVHGNHERVGEIAAELLAGFLQQNLRGLPSIPTTTLVQGRWCDGASMPGAEGRSSTALVEALSRAQKPAETAA